MRLDFRDSTPGSCRRQTPASVACMADDELEVDEHEYEDTLEPLHLIRRSHVVLRAGTLMLGSGTSGLRVREVMGSVARTVGVENLHAQVTFTNIVLTVGRRGIFRTQVAETRPSVNADRISMLQRLAHDLPERATVAEVEERLDAIERTPRLYPAWALILLVAVACASIAVLSNGGVREVVAVLPASAIAYAIHRTLTRLQLNHLPVVLTSAAIASGAYVGIAAIITAVLGSPSPRFAAGFICASIFLIPGFPLVTAGLDLARIDLDVGLPRLTYAAMVVLSIAIGVWLVAVLAGVSPDPVAPIAGHPVLVWGARVAASFFAVFGWATMFNVPIRTALVSGVVAVLGNVLRLIMLDNGVQAHVATFIACVVFGLLCALGARLFSMSKIIMTVPTLLITIPGSSALRTLLYFDRADVVSAIQSGVSTILVVIAMIAGLSGARMLTDPEWAFTRQEPPLPDPSRVRTRSQR